MINLQLQKELKRLHLELEAAFPKKTSDNGGRMTRVVEYKGKKYEIEYSYNSNGVCMIYKDGDTRSYSLPLASNLPGDDVYNVFTNTQLTKMVSILNSIVKGTEIQDGPILEVVENNKTIPYYSATMRLECEIDFQRIMGVFAELNLATLGSSRKSYMIIVNEYKGAKTLMGSPFAKLSIHSDFTINDIKAILLNYEEELPDCHIAIQSLDYAQFDGLRDRSSHYPSNELIEEWAEFTKIITK